MSFSSQSEILVSTTDSPAAFLFVFLRDGGVRGRGYRDTGRRRYGHGIGLRRRFGRTRRKHQQGGRQAGAERSRHDRIPAGCSLTSGKQPRIQSRPLQSATVLDTRDSPASLVSAATALKPHAITSFDHL